MSNRVRLPNRRFCETWDFTFEGMKYTTSYGRDAQGRIREVFLSGGKAGSLVERIMCDASTNVSLQLQYDVKPAEIAHSSIRNPDGSPASPIGVVLDDMVMG